MAEGREVNSDESRYSSVVSIIIAVFNGEKYLENTIRSILSQTYKNFELIIVDGNSSDRTVDIIKKFETDISYWVSENDKGIYDAWNKAIQKSSGQWITFIGCDDAFFPDAIESYINFINIENLLEADYISSKVQLVNTDYSPIRNFGEPWSWERFRVYMNVAHVGSFHNKNLFTKYGLFNTNYKIAADYELLLRARDSLVAGYLDKVTATMMVGGTSLKNSKVFKEAFRAKLITGGRSYASCILDDIVARVKFFFRKTFSLS